jgi:hypothetical protein
MRKAVTSLAFAFLTALWASSAVTPVFADLCCRGGCVPNGYGGCWIIGTNNYCPPVACPAPPPSSGPGQPGTGGGRTGVNPPSGGPFEGYCGLPYPPQSVAKFTNQCVKDLSVTAQFWGCGVFEDDAGRAEDARTGLSCRARKAQLASLPTCRNLCASYAVSRTFCDDRNSKWRQAFAPLGGSSYGFANVDLCGRLLSRVEKRVGRSPGVLHP